MATLRRCGLEQSASFQRLEFLGDKFLDAATSFELRVLHAAPPSEAPDDRRHPGGAAEGGSGGHEGRLDPLRSALVGNVHLASLLVRRCHRTGVDVLDFFRELPPAECAAVRAFVEVELRLMARNKPPNFDLEAVSRAYAGRRALNDAELKPVKKIGDIVDKHPEEALAIMRNWLYQE